MNVLFAASECAPFVKTGGLADVVGALPRALAQAGVAARVLLPLYPAMRALPAEQVGTVEGAPLMAARAEGQDLLLLDAPAHFDRPGGPYIDGAGRDWADNAQRFAALSRAAAHVAREGVGGWRPDILHVHDWQTGLAPVYLKAMGGGPPCMMTIHNIAYQGRFGGAIAADLGLPAWGYSPDGYEFWGDVGFLKGGLAMADRITTVSATYARELAHPAFGMGLEGVIAARRSVLDGVLNGIDEDEWNPNADPHLPRPFGARTLARRKDNRAALAKRFALDAPDRAPIFGVVSRLTPQKGLDLLLAALPRLLGRGAALAVIGTGDAGLEAAFRAASTAHAGRVGAVIGYNEPLAHLLQAGVDSLLVPSRFEPCGLTQLYALRYGAVPLVARTGGLADTVIDANPVAVDAGCATGFVHAPGDAAALADAIDRACDAYADPGLWSKLQRNGMKTEVGWARSAARYADLYREMLA
jgi:starch synthase